MIVNAAPLKIHGSFGLTFNIEGFSPLPDGLDRNAPPISNRRFTFLTYRLDEVAAEDQGGISVAAAIGDVGPRDGCIGQTGDYDLSAHRATKGAADFATWRPVRAKQKLHALLFMHEEMIDAGQVVGRRLYPSFERRVDRLRATVKAALPAAHYCS